MWDSPVPLTLTRTAPRARALKPWGGFYTSGSSNTQGPRGRSSAPSVQPRLQSPPWSWGGHGGGYSGGGRASSSAWSRSPWPQGGGSWPERLQQGAACPQEGGGGGTVGDGGGPGSASGGCSGPRQGTGSRGSSGPWTGGRPESSVGPPHSCRRAGGRGGAGRVPRPASPALARSLPSLHPGREGSSGVGSAR